MVITDVEVILWRGRYHADGLERLNSALNYSGGLFNKMRDPELHGTPGNWWVTAICEAH